MNISLYKINNGINKPIEFKGLKAQYIWPGVGIVVMLKFFAIIYIGVNKCMKNLQFGYIIYLPSSNSFSTSTV